MPTYRRLLILWFFVPLHLFLFRISGGRIFGRLEGDGSLILVTEGRKTGKRRSTPLLYFEVGEPGEYIVVASNYGQGHHPAWFLNVAANPSVSVEITGERFAAEARIAEREEGVALYDKVAAANARFAAYRAATERVIPVVALRCA